MLDEVIQERIGEEVKCQEELRHYLYQFYGIYLESLLTRYEERILKNWDDADKGDDK